MNHGASAAWVQSPTVPRAIRREAVVTLRTLGLTPLEVRRLLRRIAVETTASRVVAAWPTVGQDRATLQSAADLARDLAAVLRGASPRAQAEVATAALQALGDVGFPDRAARELAMLAAALQHRVDAMPAQSHRQALSGALRGLLDVAGHRLGAVTTWPESPFRRAAVAVYALAGMAGTSPDRAIKRLNDRSVKTGTSRP